MAGAHHRWCHPQTQTVGICATTIIHITSRYPFPSDTWWKQLSVHYIYIEPFCTYRKMTKDLVSLTSGTIYPMHCTVLTSYRPSISISTTSSRTITTVTARSWPRSMKLATVQFNNWHGLQSSRDIPRSQPQVPRGFRFHIDQSACTFHIVWFHLLPEGLEKEKLIRFFSVEAPDDVKIEELQNVEVPPGLHVDIIDFQME
jgi:hypothetical protein